ncbi:MAG: tetratricopeptide repeat protein [bacterium]
MDVKTKQRNTYIRICSLIFIFPITLLLCGASYSRVYNATKQGNLKKIKSMLDRGLEPGAQFEKPDYTPFELAHILEQTAILEALLDVCIEDEGKKKNCDGALHHAAVIGDVKRLKSLLEKGADVNAIAEFHTSRKTPVYAASYGRQPAAFLMLLKHGAKPTKDNYSTAFYAAAEKGDNETVKYLLKQSASANSPASIVVSSSSMTTALCQAAKAKQTEVIRTLFSTGANIDLALKTLSEEIKNTEEEQITYGQLMNEMIAKGSRAAKRVYIREKEKHTQELKDRLNTAREAVPLLEASRPMAAKLSREKRLGVGAELTDAKKQDIEANLKKAEGYRKAGNSTAALASYAKALAGLPEGTNREKKLREKVLTYAASLKPQPGVPKKAQHHSNRGQALLKQMEGRKAYSKALAEFEQALALAPWWADVYFNLGLVREKAGDYTGAAISFKWYLRIAPYAPDAAVVEKKLAELEIAQELSAQ